MLLTRSHLLPGGPRVRLRLARARDLRALETLLRATGCDSAPLDAHRLVRFDPRRRVVICATALIGGSEQLVGVGAIDVGAQTPDALCVAPELPEELPQLLRRALSARVQAISDRTAA